MLDDAEIEKNKRYLDVLDEIEDTVYKFYNVSGRPDLIMLYNMKEKRIYSYVYEDFWGMVKEKSILEKQYAEARQLGKIVLYLKDEEMKVLKSYII